MEHENIAQKLIRLATHPFQLRCALARKLLHNGVKWRLPDGKTKLVVYPGEDVSEQIIAQKFEVQVHLYLRDTLRRGMTFLDAGANLGLYTVIAANAVGSAGRVYSFEPSLREFTRLQRSIKANDFSNVKAYRMALAAQSGTLHLSVCIDSYGAFNSIGEVTHPAAIGMVSHREDVQGITIDEFVESERIEQIDILKLDVEGAEAQVLRGGRRLFSRPEAPVIVCELCDLTAPGLGSSTSEVLALLREFGYSIFTLSQYCEAGLQPRTERPSNGWTEYEEVVAIKAARRESCCPVFQS